MRILPSFGLFACLALAACGADGPKHEQDASLCDPNESDCVDAGSDSLCGNGARDPGESCDDGANEDGDGCSSTCRSEPGISCSPDGAQCTPIPSAPTLRNAASMLPGRELWTWDIPQHTARIELWADGIPVELEALATRYAPPEPLSEGAHRVAVRACNHMSRCSEWSEGLTVVEQLGPKHVRGLDGSSRELTQTALGKRVLVACASCATISGQPGTLEGARTKLERAIVQNTADALSLGVALIDAQLVVVQADGAQRGDAPTLEAVLDLPVVRDNEAVVILKVLEDDDLNGFVVELSKVLSSRPELAHNGRPLVVHASYERRGALAALHTALRDEPLYGPALRYWLGDNPNDESGVGLYTGANLLPELAHVDAITLHPQLPNLFNRIERARLAHRGVIIDDVAGPGLGDVVLTGLRDEVDGFVTDYQVAQARSLVAARNVATYLAARDADERNVRVQRAASNSVRNSWQLSLNQPPTPVPDSPNTAVPGRPKLQASMLAEGGHAAALSFAGGPSILDVSQAPAIDNSPGLSVSFFAVLGNADASDYSFVATTPASSSAVVRSVVTVGSSSLGMWTDGYTVSRSVYQHPSPPPGCPREVPTFTEEVEANRSYWFAWSVDVSLGRARLFIDGRCAGTSTFDPAAGPRITNADLIRTIGTQLSFGLATTNSFSGSLHQLQVLQWADRPNDERN